MLDVILADLRSRFGPKVLLDPADLIEVLGISEGQQANLRSQGRFPIPTEKVGNRVKISIYDLAKYLAGIAQRHSRTEIASLPTPLPRKEKKARKGLLERNWWALRQQHVFALVRRSEMDASLPLKTADNRETGKL